MSDIDKVLDATKGVVEELQKQNILVKVTVDKDASIVRIYGEGSHHIKRASSGLEEVMELAYTTAEHHPYWSIIYNAAEICKVALDKWESELTADQISEMSWRCDEIKMALERFQK
ncbi:MAG: hypothetical protein M3115_04450 [Thermoproteota archaeon]|nr:hypothetical protein [Thermoproteota archaeon]MDQ4101420.1 hypothetical protein [Thermoproteota archaeon]